MAKRITIIDDLSSAIEPVGGLVTGCDVTNEVNEFQHQAPEIRSPLISGYSQLTSELIRAKLREKRESTMNQMDDGGHPESNLDAVRMDIPPHLEPYMFGKSLWLFCMSDNVYIDMDQIMSTCSNGILTVSYSVMALLSIAQQQQQQQQQHHQQQRRKEQPNNYNNNNNTHSNKNVNNDMFLI